MKVIYGLVIVALTACGPQTTSTESDSSGESGSTSGASTGNGASTGADSSSTEPTSTGPIPIDCGALDEAACEAEPECEPLLAYLDQFFSTCVGPGVFAGCQAVNCPGSPCWICEGDSQTSMSWVSTCECLSEPWIACEGAPPAPMQVDQCECTGNAECAESWEFCDEGSCRGCIDVFQSCDCTLIGCAPGQCCTWEGYCLGGDPQPDGSCMMG